MLNIFMGNAMWQLVRQSDAISKMVLLVLLGMSIVCWAIFFYKIILLRAKKRQMHEAMIRIKQVHNLEQLLAVTTELSGTVPGYFLSKNLVFLKEMLAERGQGGSQKLSAHQWEMVQQNIQQVLDDMVIYEERYMPIFATSASVATLLGLFGTLWGLVHAFIGISQKQSADIAAVAPGIAEALITTLAGVIVAIPAIVMFNYLALEVRNMERHFISMADKFGLVVLRLFVS